jgi:ribosomal protein S21
LVKVVLRKGESKQRLFRRFRKSVAKSGVMKEVRNKRWFISKNEQRRLAKKKAIRRAKRRQRKKNNRTRRRN